MTDGELIILLASKLGLLTRELSEFNFFVGYDFSIFKL